jgi:regulator of sirC expression with transglutaminase-like and TPR domain
MINMVLEQKKGNPISLAVVYLLVSQRLRIPIFGVNLPKLFVLTYRSAEEIFYLNTNNRGQIFHHEDISKFIEELKIPPKTEYYEPCSHLDIIVRVLRNLEQSYTKLNDKDRVKDIRLLLTLALEG